MAEKNLPEITIHDVDPLALTLLVDFAYTGELAVCEDNVQVRMENYNWYFIIAPMFQLLQTTLAIFWDILYIC